MDIRGGCLAVFIYTFVSSTYLCLGENCRMANIGKQEVKDLRAIKVYMKSLSENQVS